MNDSLMSPSYARVSVPMGYFLAGLPLVGIEVVLFRFLLRLLFSLFLFFVAPIVVLGFFVRAAQYRAGRGVIGSYRRRNWGSVEMRRRGSGSQSIEDGGLLFGQ